MSTDLLGSGLLSEPDPGGEPTSVNRTRDTLLWKKLSQLATLGYFTSERKHCTEQRCPWAMGPLQAGHNYCIAEDFMSFKSAKYSTPISSLQVQSDQEQGVATVL